MGGIARKLLATIPFGQPVGCAVRLLSTLRLMSGHQLTCSRCGREVPPPGSPELLEWAAGGSVADLLDETAAHLLLCPECREEGRSDEELGGEG